MRGLSNARRIALGALAVAIAAAVLGRGGVGAAAQGVALAAACAALAAASRLETASFRAPLLVLGLAAGLAATLLQLVPLPPPLLGLLSPGARDIAEVALAPLGLYPAARPLTLDVPATAREVAKGAALLATAWAAYLLAGRSRSRDHVVAMVVAAGLAAAAVVAGRAAIAGEPLTGSGGPFVNPNHLAALLALAAWPALGFGLGQPGRARAGWLLAFGIIGAGLFLTLSRGGIGAFLVGGVVFALLRLRRAEPGRGPGAGRWRRRAAATAAVVLVVGTGAFLAYEPLVEEVRSIRRAGADPRSEVWASALGMVAKHPVLGIGRGAFGVAFAGHHRGDTLAFTYTHVENEWLQLPLDLGLPVGLAVLGALAWTWLSAARRRDLSHLETGVLAGTAAVAAQAVLDFALELPGVGVPFVMLLAVVAGSGRAPAAARRAVRSAAAGLVVAGLAGLSTFAAHPPDEAEGLASAPAAEVGDRARELVRWRPADYLPHAAAGARLAEAGRCHAAMAWLTRAMWLAPSVPGPHRHAARCLATSGQDALARREFRLALMLGDGGALDEAAARWTGADHLLQLVPDTPEAVERLALWLDRARRRAEAAEVLERGAVGFSDPDLLYRLGELRRATGEDARALEIARELRAREPARARTYVLAALALARLGDGEGAVRELEGGLSRAPGSPELVLALGGELLRQKRFARASDVLASGEWRSVGDAARARQLRVRALRAQGRLAEATAEARSARDLDPRSVGLAVELADVLAEAGRLEEAAAVLAEAADLPGADRPALSARREGLRAAARERAARLRAAPGSGDIPGARDDGGASAAPPGALPDAPRDTGR